MGSKGLDVGLIEALTDPGHGVVWKRGQRVRV